MLPRSVSTNWFILKFFSDYSECREEGTYSDNNIVNYTAALDKERGLRLIVCGISDMEFLEEIASGLEIQISQRDEFPHCTNDNSIETVSVLDLGIG